MTKKSALKLTFVSLGLFLPAYVLVLPTSVMAQGTPPAAAPPAAAPSAAPTVATPAPVETALPAPAAPPAAPATVEPAPAEPAADMGMSANATLDPLPLVEPAAPAESEEVAEEAEAPVPTIGGHVEAAYHRNLSKPSNKASRYPGGVVNVPLRSYDKDSGSSFMLHAAHLAFKHSFNENVGAVVEFDVGQDAVLSSNHGEFFDLQEAYATYTDSGFTLTVGKFVTYQGIEIIEGPPNPTITRGFLFGLAEPFWHVGAKAHYATGPVDIGLGLVNGWDNMIDNNGDKTIIWRLGVTPVDEFWAGLSGTVGAERAGENEDKRVSFDLTAAVIPSDMITIFLQGNFGSEAGAGVTGDDASWFGFGLQPVLTADAFSLGARLEWFGDKNGARTASDDTSYLNFTLTPGYELAEGFRLRAEYRIDTASEAVLTKSQKAQHTTALSADYTF